MFADVRQRAGDDEVCFVVLRIILVDLQRAWFRGFLGRKIGRQIFIFDFYQSDRSLRGIFVNRSNGRDRFPDVTDLSLSEEWSVLDGFAVDPGRICSRDYRTYSRVIFSFFSVDGLLSDFTISPYWLLKYVVALAEEGWRDSRRLARRGGAKREPDRAKPQ